jgi:hypothetical protein
LVAGIDVGMILARESAKRRLYLALIGTPVHAQDAIKVLVLTGHAALHGRRFSSQQLVYYLSARLSRFMKMSTIERWGECSLLPARRRAYTG